jgi:hypothetical protein
MIIRAGAKRILLVVVCSVLLGAVRPAEVNRDELVRCANLIYAGSKSSVCFSDKFLDEVRDTTMVDADEGFTPVKLSTDEIFRYPFSIMTGEGDFSLFEEERTMLQSYLTRGGFLLASAGCSSREWDRSFRREFQAMFPENELQKIPMDHPIFRTVFDIERINLKNGGTTLLEGLVLDGRIVLIYTSEGLNDTGNVEGCCCCGGNEVKNSKDINTNIITYALTH